MLTGFCGRYGDLEDLAKALGTTIREPTNDEVASAVVAAAAVLNGRDVSTGPAQPALAASVPSNPAESPVATATDQDRLIHQATDGMLACLPSLLGGITLLDNDPSALNSNLAAASFVCIALYSDTLKGTVPVE